MTQLGNYIKYGKLRYFPEIQLKYPDVTEIPSNLFSVEDKDGEGMYYIWYWDAGGGLLRYDYIYAPSLSEAVTTFLAIVSVLAALGLLASGNVEAAIEELKNVPIFQPA